MSMRSLEELESRWLVVRRSRFFRSFFPRIVISWRSFVLAFDGAASLASSIAFLEGCRMTSLIRLVVREKPFAGIAFCLWRCQEKTSARKPVVFVAAASTERLCWSDIRSRCFKNCSFLFRDQPSLTLFPFSYGTF